MKKIVLVLTLSIIAIVGYLYFSGDQLNKNIEINDIKGKIKQISISDSKEEIERVEQLWISSANGWGEVILKLQENGRFVLSYDLLEDENIHNFRGSWKNFPDSIVLEFLGEPPYMADSSNYQMIDDKSYRFQYYKDNRNEKCLEISGLVLKKKAAQEKTSDN